MIRHPLPKSPVIHRILTDELALLPIMVTRMILPLNAAPRPWLPYESFLSFQSGKPFQQKRLPPPSA